MSTSLILALVVVVLLIAAAAAWAISTRRRRSTELREHFGPEYERTVEQYGAEHKAEADLAARRERVEQLHIRPLSSEESGHFAAEWRGIQAQFVDAPEEAIAEADRVIGEVMQRRGYPMTEFEQRAADISVDHPDVVEHYRAAHATADRAASADISTEELRQALVHYRALFEALIDVNQHTEVRP